MKKLITFCTAIAVVSVLSTSCNKKLKEQMEDLESSMDEQKSKTETLQGQVNNLNGILLRAPMSVNFSTTSSGETVAFSGNYSFVYGSDYGYSYIEDNGNGTYDVYIWRGADLGTDYSGEIAFTYTPATSTASFNYAYAYGYGSNGYEVNGAYFSGTSEITNNLSVTAFDYSAGTISFTYNGSTTAAYGSNYYSNEPMTLSLSYSGAMAKTID